VRKTLDRLQKASYAAAATVQVNAFQLVESRRNRTLGAGGVAVLGMLVAAAPALAQSGCLKNQSKGAAQALESFFSGAATFLIYIGGAVFLLMMAAGGIMFMIGTSSGQIGKAKSYIKHALIGLVVLVTGVFVKEVVVNLIAGISSGTNSAECLGGSKW